MNIAVGMKGGKKDVKRDKNLMNVEELKMKIEEMMLWNLNQLENVEVQAAETQTPKIFNK